MPPANRDNRPESARYYMLPHRGSSPGGTSKTCLLPRRHAMTLLELLIALAIISVIVGFTMPVFLSARGLAHQSVCANNLRQTALALHMYRSDYDDSFPTFYVDPRSAMHAQDLNYWHDTFCRSTYLEKDQVSWAKLARPYATRTASPNAMLQSEAALVFYCPRDRDRSVRQLTSYEYKMWLATGMNGSGVEFPASTVQIWEQWSFHSNETRNEHDRRARMNVTFVDGHSRNLLLANTNSALFGSGPDLHFPFQGVGPAGRYSNQDVGR